MKSLTSAIKPVTSTTRPTTSTKKTSTNSPASSTGNPSASTKKISMSSTKRSSSSTKPLTSTKITSTNIRTISMKSSSSYSSSRTFSTSSKRYSTSTAKSLPSSIIKSSPSISMGSSSSTHKSSTLTSKQPSPASSSVSATHHCKLLAPRYPGGYDYLDWNETNNMGSNMCGYYIPDQNRPPRSYVLSVHEIYPYQGNCIQLCLATDECQSWSLDSSHTECTLHNVEVSEYIESLETSDDPPYSNYYDVTCFTCSDTIVALSCNILSDSPPAGSSCGQLGLSSANAKVASYGGYSDIQTINNCALNCMSDLDCSSFSIDQREQFCYYYNQTASNIANHYRGNTTEQTLYDVRCFQAQDQSRGCGYQK